MTRTSRGLGALPRFAMRKALRHPAAIAGMIAVLVIAFLLFLYSLSGGSSANLFSGHPYANFDTAPYREVTQQQVNAWQDEVYATYGGVLTEEKHNALTDFINAYEAEDQKKREAQGGDSAISFETLHSPEMFTKYRAAQDLQRMYRDTESRLARIAQLKGDFSPVGVLERSLLEAIPLVANEPLGDADIDFFSDFSLLSFLVSGVVILALCDTFAKEKRTRMDEMAACTLRGRSTRFHATILGAGISCLVLLVVALLLCFIPMLLAGMHLNAPYQEYRGRSPYSMTELGALGVYFLLSLLGLWCTAAVTLACAAFLRGSVLPMLLSGMICFGPPLAHVLLNSKGSLYLYTLAGLLVPEGSLMEFHAVTLGPVAIPQPVATAVLWVLISAALLILTQNHLRRRFARGIQ